MSRRHHPHLLALTLLAGAAAAGRAGAEAPPPVPCVAFAVSGLPFRACVDATAPGGGFSLRGPGQADSLGGLLYDDEDETAEEPFFFLSTDYEAGVPIGGYAPPPTYFRLTLRWDSAGPRGGALVAEVCGPEAVPVRIGPQGPPEWRSCGQWTVLVGGLTFPIDAARRRGL
jgi:hypothetical protein